MTPAKLFSLLVFVLTALYGALGFYALPMAGFQGELTRLGMLPESQFGWTKPQPAIDPTFLQQSSWKEADVLVVGDSFSDSRVWQTVLTHAGLRVRTESWDSVRGICGDFMPWLRSQGFTGKYIVLEAIERNAEDILSRSVACERMMFHPSVYADTPRSPPPVSFDVRRRDYSGKLSVGLQTLVNSWKYEQLGKDPSFTSKELSNDARLARVKNGCTLFSHVACGDSLFYSYDKAEDLPDSALNNIDALNARLPGIETIWVFVPNKSTTYLYPDKRFWDKAAQRFRSPNLLKLFKRSIDAQIVDLYPANNTHLSTTGYLIMGEAIYRDLRRQPQ